MMDYSSREVVREKNCDREKNCGCDREQEKNFESGEECDTSQTSSV